MLKSHCIGANDVHTEEPVNTATEWKTPRDASQEMSSRSRCSVSQSFRTLQRICVVIPAEAVTELNLSLGDEGDLGGVRGSDDIKHIQYMGREGIRADVNMFQRVLCDSGDNATQWEHWKLL